MIGAGNLCPGSEHHWRTTKIPAIDQRFPLIPRWRDRDSHGPPVPTTTRGLDNNPRDRSVPANLFERSLAGSSFGVPPGTIARWGQVSEPGDQQSVGGREHGRGDDA